MKRRDFSKLGGVIGFSAISGCMVLSDNSEPGQDTTETPSEDDKPPKETENDGQETVEEKDGGNIEKLAEGTWSNKLRKPESVDERLTVDDEPSIRWEMSVSQDFKYVHYLPSKLILSNSDELFKIDLDTSEETSLVEISDWINDRYITEDRQLFGNTIDGRIIGVDLDDPDILWERAAPDTVSDIHLLDAGLLVGYRTGNVELIDPDSGEVTHRESIWVTPDDMYLEFHRYSDSIVITNGKGVQAKSFSSFEHRWRVNEGGYGLSPVGDSLVTVETGSGSTADSFIRLDPTTGDVKETTKLDSKIRSFVITEDILVTNTPDGSLRVSPSDDPNSPDWVADVYAWVPRLDKNRLYTRLYESEGLENPGPLTCFDLDSGVIQWEFNPADGEFSGPNLTEYGVLVAQNNHLYILG